MTTSNDAQTQLSSKKTPKASTTVSPGNVPSNRKKLYLQSVALFLALIALGCAVYAIYTTLQMRAGANQQTQRLLSEIDSLRKQQNETTAEMNATSKTLSQTDEKLQDKLHTLDKSLQSAMQQHLYQAKDWLFLKARYYLELAQVNAHWSGDLQTTTALLQQADDLLAQVHDQRVFAIRQAIAKEIVQLQAIPSIDTAGLLSQLDAAQRGVAALSLKNSVPDSATTPPVAPANKTPSAWRERLKESVSLLEKLVVIRRHDEPIQPLPTPGQEALLRESIRLNLQAAQWAVLQKNDAVYQLSLAQAIKTIKQSFKQQAPNTQALMKQLQDLQQTHLTQKTPVLEQSLPLLNQLIESKKTTENASADAGENS